MLSDPNSAKIVPICFRSKFAVDQWRSKKFCSGSHKPQKPLKQSGRLQSPINIRYLYRKKKSKEGGLVQRLPPSNVLLIVIVIFRLQYFYILMYFFINFQYFLCIAFQRLMETCAV